MSLRHAPLPDAVQAYVSRIAFGVVTMNPYFLADALVTYSLLALSLHDARKRGWHVV
jgi:hypothetical protein